MSTINRFEDLPIWQQSRSLCNRIFRIVEKSSAFSKDYRFRDQLKAAGGSVMDNIAEGFERSSRLEFVNFLGIAKGSVGEIRSQLYRSIDNKYIDYDDGVALIGEYEKLAMAIAGLMGYLNKSTVRGQKFRDRLPGS